MGDETLAVIEGGDRRALDEDRGARGRALDQVLDHLAEFRRGLEPTDAPARHAIVLRQRLHEQHPVALGHDVVEGRRAIADGHPRVVDEASVDLVGDDP